MSQPFLPRSLLCSRPSLFFLFPISGPFSYVWGSCSSFCLTVPPLTLKCDSTCTGWLAWLARDRKKGQDSNAVYQEATQVYSLLPLYENDYPLSHRPYHCQAGEDSAILSMSYLRPEERHSLLEVSQIVTEEGADAVSPRDVMQGACSIKLLTFRWMS